MEWLNYQHLFYFWAVARYGSVVRASAELKLAQPTISGQVRRLEDVLGVKLFDRVGRRLILTEVGRTVFRDADQIFALGRDLIGAVKSRASTRPLRLIIGVADVLPKMLVQKLIEPAFHLGQPIQLVCREDRVVEDFLGDLAGLEIDLVLSDRPINPGIRVHTFNHLLGESGTSFLASPKLAKSLAHEFPRSLDGAPCLLPGVHATVRRALDKWFVATKVQPSLVAEFDDSALMYAFGEVGKGIFPVPTVVEEEFRLRYGVEVAGRTKSVRQQFYAISADRKLQHPAVVAIREVAGREIFV
jgi:LysR family transcriptional activator of nhaA